MYIFPVHPCRVRSRYLAVTFLQITHQRHLLLFRREAEVWMCLLTSECDRSFTCEVVVLRVIMYRNISTLIAKFMGPTWGPSGPTGPKWAPCWPHEPCYLGSVYSNTFYLPNHGRPWPRLNIQKFRVAFKTKFRYICQRKSSRLFCMKIRCW